MIAFDILEQIRWAIDDRAKDREWCTTRIYYEKIHEAQKQRDTETYTIRQWTYDERTSALLFCGLLALIELAKQEQR